MVRLLDHVKVAARFHRSVNVELDYERSDSLDSYVVSPLARDVTTRITTALTDTAGARAWTLIGPYGSGKSSLVAFLTTLVCDGPAYVNGWKRFRRSWPEQAAHLEQMLFHDDCFSPLVPVLVTGERVHFARAILTGLKKSAARFWSGRGTTPEVVGRIAELSAAADAGDPVDHDAIVEVTLDFAQKVNASNRNGKGLFIVLDEMGKLLEWAALNPHDADLYLLQRLAEAAARSKAPIGLLTVLHQDLSAYAANLTRSMRDEWTKIGGRFETIVYLEPVHHLVRLLDGAIESPTDLLKSTPAGQECDLTASELSKDLPNGLPLLGAFPLHPLAALCIGPLFRTAIGQNERSVFAFLNSNEPLGFQDWLARADGSEPYRLSDLFNYVVHNTSAVAQSNRAWTAAEYAISRLGNQASSLDTDLIRSIALLSMVQPAVEVRADEATLRSATGRTEKAVKRALNRLKRSSVALYVKHKRSWELWDGSDIDIDELVAQHRSELSASGGLAEQIEQAVQPTPIIASRHYIQTGTFRVLRVRYASTLTVARELKPKRGDGVLVLLVPDQLDALADMQDALNQVPADPATTPPRVFAVPVNVERFHEVGLDFLAVTRALTLTPELENDPIARRVLQERHLATRDALQAAHELACIGSAEHPVRWRYRGEWVTVEARASSMASAVFDHAFDHAPRVHNELINRSQLSSAAAAGRRILMQRMLMDEAQPRLSIEGFPPELSMYRSILERMGLHQEVDGSWRLVGPPDARPDDPIARVWRRIGELLRSDAEQAGGRRSFEDVARCLAEPPYGVRAGVAPILIWAWYLVHRDEVFLYEDSAFVPEPDDAFVERLLRQPKAAELQSAAFSGQLAELAMAVRERAFSHLDLARGRLPLRVVRQLVLFVKRLSTYAQRTRNVSTEAIRVRAELLSAKDTVKLLVDALPDALGVDLQAEGSADTLALRLARTLDELRTADQHLLTVIDQTLRTMFGVGEDDARFYEDIAHRAVALRDAGGAAPLTQRFIEQTAELEPRDDESKEIWLKGVGTTILGKMPDMWSDTDVHRFKTRAEERIRAFLATERLAFQMKKLNGAVDGRPIMRVDYIDNAAGEVEQFGQFGIREGAEDDLKVVMDQASAEIEKLRNFAKSRSVSDRGVAYAVLKAMMQTLHGTSVQEND